MKASDVALVQVTSCWPEQYDAIDCSGQVVGYIRLKNGYLDVYCPDAEGADMVYDKKYSDRIGKFSSDRERRKQLRRARLAISAWWDAKTESLPHQ